MTRWAPVVYGRTAASDTWWRAVPTGLDETGWLGSVVAAAVSRGLELDRAPRFLFAQDRTHRIVGVACQAADLNSAMSTDGDREFYCFVGWVAPRDEQPERAGPSFRDLSRGYVGWAGPVYTEVLGKVWTVSATAYCPPERTRPEPVPWPPGDRDLAPAPRPGDGDWPEEAWPGLWAAVQAASTPLTCVVGWRNQSSARAEGATHVGVADAPPRSLPRPVVIPAQERVPPIPVQRPQPDLVRPVKPVPGPETARAKPGVPAGRPARRLPVPAAIGAAAVIGAGVGALITALVTGGSPAAPPTAPVTIQLVVPVSAPPAPGTLLRYRDGVLSAGASAARLAVWTGGPAPSAATCAATLRATPAAAPISATPGVRVCVELTGQPARYGVVGITAVSPAAVTAEATIWP